ncbi:MAG: metal ABC transporter substrate-binding protein [Haloferacaceae archaeon]
MTTHSRRETLSRRRFAALGGGGLVAGLAGCLGEGDAADADGGEPSSDGDDDEDADGPVVVASFFTFYDFARKIAADTPVTVENLVPVGMHGHGWEPDPTITRDVIDADAFVHVGEDFQPWADRTIQTVRDDDADTSLIDAREGIELLPLAESLEEDEAVGDGEDPHFWLDPSLAKQAVDNVAAGLVDVAPDHESTLSENAEGLRTELEALDSEWQEVFDAAERDVVFLAAHNAFEYVGERYGVTVNPLVENLAASDDVKPRDRRRARETIDEHDIRYIGAAVFESRRPARQLRSDTPVEAYFPVTPYAGITEEWVERDWGYFEIARNINVPTFEILTGAVDPDDTSLGDEWRNFE